LETEWSEGRVCESGRPLHKWQALPGNVQESGGQESERPYERGSGVTAMERRERRKVDEDKRDGRRRHRRQCPRGSASRNRAGQANWPSPTSNLFVMLTTPSGVTGSQRCSGWAGMISPHRSGSDRSILSEVNHRLESRVRENPPVRFGGRRDGQPFLPIPIARFVHTF
jgi:hypothetical protein